MPTRSPNRPAENPEMAGQEKSVPELADTELPKPGQPILAAIDFSPYSAQALLWAARTARLFDAPLIALHVVHDPESAPGYYQRTKKRKKHLIRFEEAAGGMMSEFLDQLRKQHPKKLTGLDARLVVGLPVTRVLEVAAQVGAQLIVVGSQGRTGLDRLMLGSKAERIAQLSPIPVTIVKSEPGP